MISPILVGLVVGAVAARSVIRRRQLGYAGGCRGATRFGRWPGRRGFGRFRSGPDPVELARVSAERLNAQVAALELNARQKETLEEVFSVIRDEAQVKAISDWPALDRAWESIAGDEFEPDRVRDQPEKILDALEHLHNILTPEQRAALR